MKIAIVVLILATAGCTTVRTFDRNGDLTGSCRIRGLFRGGGSCIGYANDESVTGRALHITK